MNINSLHAQTISGDRAAEEQLFQSLSERFALFLQHKVRNRQDAEEVLQETLMTISAKYQAIEFEDSFAAWAYKVLTNNVLMYYRTKGRNDDRLTLIDDIGNSQTVDFDRSKLEMRLLGCLKKLNRANRRHARIVNLHYQGYKTAEICSRMELSRNGLYLLLMRARTALKACVEKGEMLK